jgi:hypothetical protein
MCHNFQYVLQTSIPETLNSFSAYILSKCMCTAGSKLDTLDCPRATDLRALLKESLIAFAGQDLFDLMVDCAES